MIMLLKAIRTLTERRQELQVALADHSKTARRVAQVAEDISRENRRREWRSREWLDSYKGRRP